MFLDLGMSIDIEYMYLIETEPYSPSLLLEVCMCDKRLLKAFNDINEPFLFFLSYQWKILMVMMFDADGLNLQRESVVVSAELLMPLCLG